MSEYQKKHIGHIGDRSTEPTGIDLQTALEPYVEDLTNRHIDVAKPWYPHEYIPWDEGRNYARLGGEDWREEQSTLNQVARAAMRLNLLTEDNLPGYFSIIQSKSGLPAWQEWANRWTAEEARHSEVMRMYLLATRGIDPIELDDARMAVMSAGYQAGNDKSLTDTIAYVSFQEAATAVSHANTGKAAGSDIAEAIMDRVTKDERLHTAFYRGTVRAGLQLAPNQMMRSIHSELVGFEMPGSKAIPGFARAALLLARGDIYNIAIHTDAIAEQTVKSWKLDKVEGLTSEGERDRDAIFSHIANLRQQSDKFIESQAIRRAREQSRQ